ncbi:hypothetical protein CR513_16991, partial [Mucuna pruriens]
MIVRVLIDNSSSLNINCTPRALPKDQFCGGKGFDGSKREVMGEITLPICIGQIIFDITFQVMDIWPAYSDKLNLRCRVLTHLGYWPNRSQQRLSRYGLGRDLLDSKSTDCRLDAIELD